MPLLGGGALVSHFAGEETGALGFSGKRTSQSSGPGQLLSSQLVGTEDMWSVSPGACREGFLELEPLPWVPEAEKCPGQ